MKAILLLSSSMARRDWICAEKIVRDPQIQAYMLAYDRYVCPQIRKFDDKVLLLDDYLPASEWDNINKLSAKWAKEWYRQPALEGKMTWQGIELPSMVEYNWMQTLHIILRLCCMVTRLIDNQKPDRLELFLGNWEPASILVYNDEPLLELIAKHVAIQKGLEVVNHACRVPFLNAFYPKFNKTKVRSLLREVRNLGLRLLSSKNIKLRRSGIETTQHALFVSGARSIQQIAQAFQNGGNRKSLYVAFGWETLSTAVRHQKMEAYIPLIFPSIYRRAIRLLAGQSADIRFSLADIRFFKHYDIDLFPVIELWIKYFLRAEFPRRARNIESAEGIILDAQPDVIVTDNRLLELAGVFLTLARKHGIVSIELQHGLLASVTCPQFPADDIADLFIFWGRLDRDKKLALGKDLSRFMLGGNSNFDAYFEYLKKASDVVVKKQSTRIGVTCALYNKFFGEYGSITLWDKYFRSICDAARKMSEVTFSFKIKSGYGNYHMVKNLLAEYGIENFEIVETVRFEEWFSSLSALITDTSSMGLEAMIFDVPVVILDFEKWEDPVGFESSDAVDVVHSAEELHHALSANMQKPERRAKERAKFVRYALADTEGTAAKRTVQIISQLLHERKTTRYQQVQHG